MYTKTLYKKGFEVPKAVVLVGEVSDLNQGFSVENGLLTPTFKLKRVELSRQYKTEIDQAYASLAAVGSK